MSFINNKQYDDFRSLYESIYSNQSIISEKNEEELKIVYLENFSDEEIFNMFVEEIVNEIANELEEEGIIVESAAEWWNTARNLVGRAVRKITGYGKGVQHGLKPPKVPGENVGATVGSRRREVTGAVIGGATTQLLSGTPLGKEIVRRLGAAGQGLLDPSKTETPSMYK